VVLADAAGEGDEGAGLPSTLSSVSLEPTTPAVAAQVPIFAKDAGGAYNAPLGLEFSSSYGSSVYRSPGAGSPIGLTIIPKDAPLVGTDELDINCSFEWPESKLALANSRAPSPAVSTATSQSGEQKEQPAAREGALSAPSSPGADSFVTSPQDLPQGDSAPSVPPSEDESEATAIDDTPTEDKAAGDPLAPKAAAPALHCRACKADSCDEITATMCGHIFCNKCIVDAVIKSSRCPECAAPTLLYCLFRLNL